MNDAGKGECVDGAKREVELSEEEETEEEDDDADMFDSDEDDDDKIARIQRAHLAQAAALAKRRRAPARPRRVSQKRKLEQVKNFHDFTKKLKKDTGIVIRSILGKDMLEYPDFSSEESKSDSDGLSEEEFVVNPNAVAELDEGDESHIDPETGDIVQGKAVEKQKSPPKEPVNEETEEPKTLSISDLINEGELDLSKNVEIAEVDEGELCSEKTAEELLGITKQDENSQEFELAGNDGEVTAENEGAAGQEQTAEDEKKPENEDEKKPANANALNIRRNIREVMDEKNLDASTLAAQRQESERLARVQEQQRLIREVQRQIAINRQNKVHQKTMQLLQGSSLLKKGTPGQKLNLPNTVVVKLPSGEVKKTTMKQGQVDVTRISKPTTSGSLAQKIARPDQKPEKKDVVEIVSSSSGEEESSSSSDSDDCIMLSDSEVPPSPEAEDDPGNSGLHVNDTYNIPDEQGRVLINIGHPENGEDIFLAPQIARIIKPHQIGGVRFLFDNIIESVERFSTSTGFGCILAHSMGLGKTLQIVCFCDIFLRHTTSKTVLCIMPINTLQNWVAEFNKWLPSDPNSTPLIVQGEVRPRNFPIYVLNDSHKTLQMRAKVVKDWSTTGGVLMIGYELYRLLSMKKDKKPRKKKKAELKLEKELAEKEKEEKKNDGNDDTQNSEPSKVADENEFDPTKLEADKDDKKEDTTNDEDKKLLDEMYEALVKPGPDLVICDEGHRIKNSHSNISYALKQMRTKRRVVLTGYPLQNNLLEYWCMVDFVRPNYLGSKTEFCNMFERPIQNGQCIDSTPQDIRLMRYRAHVLHSLLVGFVQRRSHAVLQSTLPQKEEYVLLVRMTPLQRELYDRFMNEVVRSSSVPNPLKAFAICCKIWNHPDVLYNFLRKRSEANAAIEEDLDLEEIGGVTKSGRAAKSKAQPRRAAKPRGTPKKPAATIPPNQSVGPQRPNHGEPSGYGNMNYGPKPLGPPYRPDQQDGSFPSYPNYPNQGQGYYPPNQSYNQNYPSNYYPQQSQPYGNSFPNQFPTNSTDPNYNPGYWGNGNYYGDPNFYNNQPPADYRGNGQGDFNNTHQFPQGTSQPYPQNNTQQYPPNDPNYSSAVQPYSSNNQDSYQRPPYQPSTYPNSQPYPSYSANPQQPYPPQQSYPNQQYPPSYPENSNYGQNPAPFNQQYESRNYPYQSTANIPPNQPKIEPGTNFPPTVKTENTNHTPYDGQNNPEYNFNQGTSFAEQGQQNSSNYPTQFGGFPPQAEVKTPLGSSDSPVTAWPIPDTIKPENDRLSELKAEAKTEVKSESSDGEVKIEDLDTKKIVKEESKNPIIPKDSKTDADKKELSEKVQIDSGDDATSKKGKQKGKGKEPKKMDAKRGRGKAKAKGRKDRKTSKDKDDSDSESEKEEKLNKEEELALLKKAEEMTYDWAAELLKEYIPGVIENSAKMELFFYILNESIKMGDRILLFSQSLFTLNLIEDYLERNYIPGTNRLWERNTSYYRLDGSTHALEREKLINEFNANPHVYLFLVSTRAGSLGINLVGANRVIVFDASWNPCHDTQAVCRVYRYGQKKPCFVYRFVMACCLEKKIYDRQINKQGMADRVVDECNPDAVLSMKEITNLCFDNDEKESEIKDLSEHKDKYIDVIMQGIITQLGTRLSKEPFQHESLLVDRKEKKLSSAEKRLAQRGYELEKKAASAPKPTTAYRTVRTADGSLVTRPVASVRPMQHGARWIPADVWRRQGMTAQEMTLPLDVVIPTNSAEKTNIVLKAGQRVMVLKSPKGIYMQLESGKIIAIKTSLKGLGQKPGENKDASVVGKKVMTRPSNLPGSLKNNSAITITSKNGPRPGVQRVMRPLMGQNRGIRPVMPGQRMADIRQKLSGMDMKSYPALRKIQQGRPMRPNVPGSVSITKINAKSNDGKIASDDETQVLDSDEETDNTNESSNNASTKSNDNSSDTRNTPPDNQPSNETPLVLTTEEIIPPEAAFESKSPQKTNDIVEETPPSSSNTKSDTETKSDASEKSKINLLKNYRHQRLGSRPIESSLSQLEKTACSLNKEGLPDFRKNLDDITQSYSPTGEEKPNTKSRKKRSPTKVDASESQSERQNTLMTHSVSSMLGSGGEMHNTAPVAPLGQPGRMMSQSPMVPSPSSSHDISHGLEPKSLPAPPPHLQPGGLPLHPMGAATGYPPANAPPDAAYGQYPPGYGYGAYPNPGYYGGYGAPPYYGGYPAPPPYPQTAPPHKPPEGYPPPNNQW